MNIGQYDYRPLWRAAFSGISAYLWLSNPWFGFMIFWVVLQIGIES